MERDHTTDRPPDETADTVESLRSEVAALKARVCDLESLLHLANAHADAVEDELRARNAEVETLNNRLRAANAELAALAKVDLVTRLPNSERFRDVADDAWTRYATTDGRVAMLLADVDGRVAIAAEEGQQAADDLLCALAAVCSVCLRRPDDIVARYRDDGVAVLLTDAESMEAADAAKLVHTMFARTVTRRRANHGATVSVSTTSDPPRTVAGPMNRITALVRTLHNARAAGGNTTLACPGTDP